jgi:endonuclease YncB( thermonuclease family)
MIRRRVASPARAAPAKPGPTSRRAGLFFRRAFPAACLSLIFLAPPLTAAGAPAASGAFPAAAAVERATVIDVVDGDTIRIRTGAGESTVRLVGIDAPERGHPSRRKEFMADEAAEALESLCRGKTVRLERDLEEADKYGRLLRYVATDDGSLPINREMVRRGMARVYRRFPFSRRDEFDAAEAGAKRDGLGIWRDEGFEALRWTRERGQAPALVWPLGGGDYGVALDGMIKAGVPPEELGDEVERVVRLRVESSDADFAAGARKAGFRALEGGTAAAGAVPGVAVREGATAGEIVSWDRAHEAIGRKVTVEGTIVRAKRSRRTVFLNFHGNWKRYVTIVLFPEKVRGLPSSPESHYLNRKIRVTGTVVRYADRPEIVLESADDLRIVP